MILAGFIADQRTTYRVPQAVACRALAVSQSWFYKWSNHTPSAADIRRRVLDTAVRGFFDVSKGTYGSPRILVDLREAGQYVRPTSTHDSDSVLPPSPLHPCLWLADADIRNLAAKLAQSNG